MSELLEQVSDYAFQRLDAAGGNLEKIPVELQVVILIYSAQGVIDNGGFQYFFESDFPGNPPYSKFIFAYRQIGAVESAISIDQAVSLFPFDSPHLHAEERSQFLDSISEKHALFMFGDNVCNDQSVWEKLENFVSKQPTAFEG